MDHSMSGAHSKSMASNPLKSVSNVKPGCKLARIAPKTVFVQAEVEVAIEKGCRLIGANLNNSRFKDSLCPYFFADKGALFVPFSSRILAKALGWSKPTCNPALPDDWNFSDQVYMDLGYQLIGNTAVLPPPPNPFLFGKPTWAK